MRLTDVLYLPYSQAHFHFKQADNSEWKGRIVHKVVGALEYIPVLNYLIVIVDLVVQRLFKSNPPKPDPVTLPKAIQQANLDDFLRTHRIELPKTPLLQTILEIEDKTRDWDESILATDVYWISRARPLGDHISKLNGQVEECKLKPLKDSCRKDPLQVFKDLKILLAELKGAEEENNQLLLQELRAQFATLNFPQIGSFSELMTSMGFVDKVRIGGYEWSMAKLPDFGLANPRDFQSIGFFDFEDDYRTAVYFEVVVKSIPAAGDTYRQFLESFGRKVERWEYRAHAQSDEMRFTSAETIQLFIQKVRPLLLLSYLRQHSLNDFWSTFPANGRSLDTYLQGCDPKPSPFGLGFQIEDS